MSLHTSFDPYPHPSDMASRATAPFLKVARLSKRFGATLALDDVEIAFFRSRIHCVLGENGAGKSTLGKIIGGVYPSDSGIITVDGEVVPLGTVARARRLGIAVVFQELSLALDLSVRANLLLGVEPHAHPFACLRRKWESERVRAILKRLNVEVSTEARVGRLPVATRQLLEVAKALIRRPRMLVLDEPTAMLNEVEKRNLFTVLSALRSDGATIALITHHLEDAEALADHVSVMRDGRVVDSITVSGASDFKKVVDTIGGPQPTQRRVLFKKASPEAAFLRIEGLFDLGGKSAPLSVKRGEIVGLYGVVGCGSQQVGDALAGLRPASNIDITLDGKRRQVKTPVGSRRLGISYLPAGRASNGILPGRSIRENLNISLLSTYSRAGIICVRREAADTRRQLAESSVKYADDRDDITRLSGGNQQKILVARTLRAGSNLLVLEDPTAGIDIDAKREIQTAIRRRADSGVAVVLISNDLLQTIELVDTLITLYAGKVVCRYSSPQVSDKSAIVADVIGQHTGAGSFDSNADSILESPSSTSDKT